MHPILFTSYLHRQIHCEIIAPLPPQYPNGINGITHIRTKHFHPLLNFKNIGFSTERKSWSQYLSDMVENTNSTKKKKKVMLLLYRLKEVHSEIDCYF